MKSIRPVLAAGILALPFACTSEKKEPENVVQPAAPAPVARALPTTLDEALASEFRSTENRPRDAYRHPKETLEFFGLKPQMKVVEITPGRGWYAEILAPYLSKDGQYIAALAEAGDSEYLKKANADFSAWYQKYPELKVTSTNFDPTKPLGVEGADMLLTFRNVHNWQSRGLSEKAFKSFFAALKPGGVLGVVEHRADKKGKADPKAASGYMKESDIIRLAEKAGFKLEGKSEINANPKDTKKHPDGVWSLPPTLKGGDKDRQKFLAIGESDRMTLKFVKPAAKK